MSLARWLLAAVAAMLSVAFSIVNWTPVPLVFGATEVVVRLPVLVLAVAALVWIPASIRVRLAKQRVAALTLAAAVPPAAAYVPPVSRPAVLDQAQPTIVPPGCG